ncbi:Coproporphyrinogen-III oxidase [Marasmius sp. AFHP31]|nr:Coproporphyrinogen-III oxidase [Marasmius sp. AFHP31]
MREEFTKYIQNLQLSIVSHLESLDPSSPPFQVREWTRGEGGSGKACTFTSDSDDAVFEKAGVNISMINGKLPPPAIKQMALDHSSVRGYSADVGESLPFWAGGISMIIHPRNPNVPTFHANYRYFEILDSEGNVKSWWFGGITDLTPSYLFEEDIKHFHQTLKDICDSRGPDLYPAFKKSCDGYFFLKHRNEYRGIGGIRFDDLCDEPHSLLPPDSPRPRSVEDIFSYIQALGNSILPSYVPIVERRNKLEWTPVMRRWQTLRRGRYVEFNLIYDRGTKFGLATPGVDVENILVSMPQEVRWEYMSDLGAEGDGSEESKMVEVLKNAREWAV